jgi:hypothetical protein
MWRPTWWRRAETGAGPTSGGWPARLAVVLVPAAVYLLLGVLRLAPVWRSPTRLAQCGCGDAAFTMWYLGWTPHALGHGIDPFFTDSLFFPSGVNTLWNVSLPLPGVLLAPLTARWGVVFSYNVLIVLAFGATALSAYLVLRRWVRWPPAAFAGGLLYGFSPYMIGQGLGHVHMVLLALVPVVLLLLDEVLVRQRLPVWVSGPLLGVAAVAQLLTAEEVLASSALIALLGAVLLVVLFPGQVRPRLRHAATGLALAALSGLLLAALPLKHQLTGPQRLAGTVSSPGRYRADLLSWVVPSRLMHFAPGSALRASAGFGGNVAENGSYLGIPLLLVVLAVTVVLWRRRPVVRWAGVLLVVVMVLSSGPSLQVDGKDTGVPLPFALLRHVPLMDSLVSVRLASYAVLLSGLLLAVGMDELREWLRASRRREPGGEQSAGRWRLAGPVSAGVLAVLALLPMLPASYRYDVRDIQVPLWYRSAAVRQRVAAGSVLVTVPAASPADSAPMLWQAVAHYRFKVPFGYSLHPGPDGRGHFGPYASTFAGITARMRRGPQPRVSASVIRAMRADLRRWQARTIVVTQETNANVAAQVDLLTRVVGRPPEHDSGAWVWYNVDPAALTSLPVVPPPWPARPLSLPAG